MPVRRHADARVIPCAGSKRQPHCIALSRPGRTQCTVHDPGYQQAAGSHDWMYAMSRTTTLADLEREC